MIDPMILILVIIFIWLDRISLPFPRFRLWPELQFAADFLSSNTEHLVWLFFVLGLCLCFRNVRFYPPLSFIFCQCCDIVQMRFLHANEFVMMVHFCKYTFQNFIWHFLISLQHYRTFWRKSYLVRALVYGMQGSYYILHLQEAEKANMA